MVASGVPRPRPDHAHVLARLALDMHEFVNQRTFGEHKVSLRIGINSGPVVAGVIGRKKFIYDLWATPSTPPAAWNRTAVTERFRLRAPPTNSSRAIFYVSHAARCM